MNKTNTKSIVFGLKILSILAFSLLIIPIKASAIRIRKDNDNPAPRIVSISPNSINSHTGTGGYYSGTNYVGTNIVVVITGNGFIPNSIARINGSNRQTTFIDSSHLLIISNQNDTINTEGFYINVFNGAPGGGYSNAKFFTVENITPTINADYNNNPSYTITKNPKPVKNIYPSNVPSNIYSNSAQTQSTTSSSRDSLSDTKKDHGNLAATAIFGSNTFLPSGLTQWVLFGIIILLIVIFVRKIFSAKKYYGESPMKHA